LLKFVVECIENVMCFLMFFFDCFFLVNFFDIFFLIEKK